MKKILPFIFCSLLVVTGYSQPGVQPAAKSEQTVVLRGETAVWPFFSWAKNSTETVRTQPLFVRSNNDWRFYAATLLVFLFGVAKTAFAKMYRQLITLMFRSTVKSRQIREQLQHTTIPSLSFNLLFVFTASLLLLQVLLHYLPAPPVNSFLLWLLCAGGVAAIYLVKFVWLKLAGWVFRVQETAETYLFYVFFLNKILGIILIPVCVLLLLNNNQLNEYLLITSYFIISIVLLYRYYLAYGAAQKTIKASPFHFLLYICAVEITPPLLIYKVLFNFLAY